MAVRDEMNIMLSQVDYAWALKTANDSSVSSEWQTHNPACTLHNAKFLLVWLQFAN